MGGHGFFSCRGFSRCKNFAWKSVQLIPIYHLDNGQFYAKLLLTRNNKDMHCIPYMTVIAMHFEYDNLIRITLKGIQGFIGIKSYLIFNISVNNGAMVVYFTNVLLQ